jgi:DNA-binding response OmpR family regulator
MENLPNLLIVDDNPEQLAFFKTILQKLSANLIVALSGFEALEKTRGKELALAIIDVRMPVMNGYELALKMLEERPGEKVPIIFLTASHINETQVFQGYNTGAVDYIFKPADNNILLCKVNVFLDLFSQRQTILKHVADLKYIADELTKANVALKKKTNELEHFNNLMVGREMKMIELKKEINELLKKSGETEKYIIHK